MTSKPSIKARPAPKALPGPPVACTAVDPVSVRTAHGKAVPGAVYAVALIPTLGEKGAPEAAIYAQDVIARMAPRDAAEEMLIAQLLFAHARVMRLTELANRQTEVHALRVLHEYADRASNTYRRLMLALAEYRRPPRTGDTFAVVKQTNIAGQQLIQNHEKAPTIATNEQGCTPSVSDARNAPEAPSPIPALPADSGGVDLSAFVRPAREAVGAVHRPTDARRQGSVAAKRGEAW